MQLHLAPPRLHQRASVAPACLGLALIFLWSMASFAQPTPAQQDESEWKQLRLPDPLVLKNGRAVRTSDEWQKLRRPELLELFSQQMFGQMPPWKGPLRFKVWDESASALGGKAIRKQVTLWMGPTEDAPSAELLLYLPAQNTHRTPVFLSLNFQGNMCVSADPAIRLNPGWFPNNPGAGITNNRASERTRGVQDRRWPLDRIVERGYGFATVYCGDFYPDHAQGYEGSVLKWLNGGSPRSEAGEAGQAIATWAWGLSRAMDYLVQDPHVDARRVAVLGHSRLGKTSLWAGASDERFAVVISNNSGEGGAALSRRHVGEDIRNLNERFPHWFCKNYTQYSGKAGDLPFDQHELIALSAPRPVYVASATDDQWADPQGEFMAGQAAEPVYALFGLHGLGVKKWPAPDQPVGQSIGYHLRSGPHDILLPDWEAFMDFMDRHHSPSR